MRNVINIFNITAGHAVSITFHFGKVIYACTSLEAAESIAKRWKKAFGDAIVDIFYFRSVNELEEL